MALVRTGRLFEDAKKGGYAIPAFNVENAEMVRAVAKVASKCKSPIIFQTTSSTLKYMNPDYYVGLVKAAVKEFGITAALHLDHGSSLDLVKACIEAGYTSVMYDGSSLSLEENIANTKEVKDYARLFGISVEAELGTIGGKEDDVEGQADYTDPEVAKRFVEETNVDSLAIAFGTAHGFYEIPPVLDLNRITLIANTIDTPLVMHGGSGLSLEEVSTAIKNGICKVNFATELRDAFTRGIKSYFEKDMKVIDPKKYLLSGMQELEALVENRINMTGSVGKDNYH